jgi:hypothetical protein
MSRSLLTEAWIVDAQREARSCPYVAQHRRYRCPREVCLVLATVRWSSELATP